VPERKDRPLIDRMTSSPVNYWASMVIDLCVAGAFAYWGARWHSGPFAVAVATVILGLSIWTLVEYLMHRYVLHGSWGPPSRGHREHHRRPRSMISTPVLTIAISLTFLWVVLASTAPRGITALLLFGIYAGYNYFAVVHHLQHHHGSFLERFRFFAVPLRLHLLHHHRPDMHFGITTSFWDRVLGTFLEDHEVVTKRAAP
jgi:sterol desaturase/sphingolipid hydroxylase (fatty acid hydroxylase superfamily)